MPEDFNQQIIDEFRANDGRVGGPFEGGRLILLTTTGARSGRRRTTPLGYLPDGDRVLVIASAAGAPKHPAWFHNLKTNPRVTVEGGPFTYEADAIVLEGREREDAWARAVESDPGWAEYQAQTDRVIPVVALAEVPGPPDLGARSPGEALKAIHDVFRRELALIRAEVENSGPGLGAQLRVNCLTLCQGLSNHHEGEDAYMFPALGEQHPELAGPLARLKDEHEVVKGLLEELQAVISDADAERGTLLAEVDRLAAELEAHLAYEERLLIPIFDGTVPLPHVSRIPAGPQDGAEVRARMQDLFSLATELPAGADRTPVLPETGGVATTWVTATAGEGATIYVHGGGFTQRNPDMEPLVAYRFARATGRPVVAVDYRLAPAHPFPAAMDDVVAVHRALLDQGVPAERIVMIGESAGATLVLSALLALKASGVALPAAAIAVSPPTDLTASGPSCETNDATDVINHAVLDGLYEQYLNGARRDQAPQSPLHGDLSGLPPLLLAVGADEVLLDDSRRFADAAAAAGADVTLDIYDAMPHAFHLTALVDPPCPQAATLLDRVTAWLAR